MNLFSKLFGDIDKTPELVVDYSNKIFGMSFAICKDLDKEFEELKMFSHPVITLVLCAGVINCIDRIAFIEISQERHKLMNQLINYSFKQFDNIFSSSTLSKSQTRDLFFNQMNNFQTYLGAFKKYSSEGNESPKNTFVWEFGKLFAKQLDESDNITFIQLGMYFLNTIIEELKIKDFVKEYKNLL